MKIRLLLGILLLTVAACAKPQPNTFEENIVHSKYDEILLEQKKVELLKKENFLINQKIVTTTEELQHLNHLEESTPLEKK